MDINDYDAARKELVDRIKTEMTVNYANTLARNFEKAKKLVRITTEGMIDVLNKEVLKGEDRIILYLIGKLYAKEAQLAESESASNEELMNELGIKAGSLFPWTKNLRDSHRIKTETRNGTTFQRIALNVVESELTRITDMLNKE